MQTNKQTQAERTQILQAGILVQGVPLEDFTAQDKSFDLLNFPFLGFSGNYILQMPCRFAVEFNKNLCHIPGTVPAHCRQNVIAPGSPLTTLLQERADSC